MKKSFCLILTGLLLSAGCATDRGNTQATGAGFGAVLGATVGAIIGHQSGNAAEGAALGAMVGGVAGFTYGDHVADKKEEYASQEDYLDACIAEAGKVYQDTLAYNQNMQQQINGASEQIAALKAQAGSNQQAQQQLANVKKDLQNKQNASNERMAAIQDEIAVQKQVLANESQAGEGQRLNQLQQQIQLLEGQQAELQRQSSQLASLSLRASA